MGRGKVSARRRDWPAGILSRVSREAYDATARARGFQFMTPEEREAAARSYDELTGRRPSRPARPSRRGIR